MTVLCNNSSRGEIKEDTRINDNFILTSYLYHEKNVLTPTVYNSDVKGFFVNLAALIFYAVQRPFAFLIALPIRSDINSKEHPILAKIGRHLTAPKYYQKCACDQLKGYLIGGEQGKAEVIVAQFQKKLIQRYIQAEHFSQINDICKNAIKSYERNEEFSDDDMEKFRLVYLRVGIIERFEFKKYTFKGLFDQGYLQLQK